MKVRQSAGDDEVDTEAETPAQPRNRWTAIRQISISCLVVVVVLIGTVWSLPDSPVKDAAAPVLAPVASATGLDQNWRMFAPNPPRVVSDIAVVVAMRDGAKRVWRFEPDNSDANLFNWDRSRQRKMKEAVITQKAARPGFAGWVIRQVTKPGEQPVRVTIVLESKNVPPPGQGAPPATPERKVLFDEKFAVTK